MKTTLSAGSGRARGFTMLEVLISIVVIAFGMLGVAGLQAFALKNSQGASLRSIATVLSTDLVDRMKANPVGTDNGAYANAAGERAELKVDSCLTAAGCPTAADLAAHDLFEWHAQVAAALPNGVGMVCIDSTPNDGTPTDAKCDGKGAFAIKIWWVDDRNASNKLRERTRFSTEFQL